MFRTHATQQQLMSLSRTLGVSLASGIDIIRAFEMAARKTDPRMRAVLNEIISQLKSGETVTAAFESHHGYFPDLFVDMLQVGEATGSLPEVLKSLSLHYENNIRLRKDFISQITMPMVQMIAAILIIGFLIWVLGIVGAMSGSVQDVIGFGLIGTSGALTWFGGWALVVAALFIAYKMVQASLSSQKVVHRFLLGIPVIGSCMQAFAIARFSWAFHLTQNAGMPIGPSLDSSLRATSNGAFIAAAPQIIDDINDGKTLTDSLENSGLFPFEFIEMVRVGETSGTVPEALDHLGPQFEDDARRSLSRLATAFGWLIWSGVALFIIIIVLKIMLWYVGQINELANGLNKI